MILAKAGESTPRELIKTGNSIARCYSFVHIGTNTENILGEDKVLNKVRITWELPLELRIYNEDKGMQPMVISKEYTLSLHEKANLRKDLDSWRGKAFTEEEAKSFDITKLLGVPCLLNVIHKETAKGNKYAMIASITPLMTGMDCPDQVNETFEFNYDDKFDTKFIEAQPDFIKDKIKSSVEYKKCIGELEGEHYDSTAPQTQESGNEPQEAPMPTEELPF